MTEHRMIQEYERMTASYYGSRI